MSDSEGNTTGGDTTGGDTSGDTTPFKPTEPIFGGVKEVGKNHFEAWTGGKPNGGFSLLETELPTSIAATRFRPSSISSGSKAQQCRVQGLENKFSADGDLQVFQKKVMKHLELYGLDTITYLRDPTDEKQVVSVITDHARFNCVDGVKAAKEHMEKYYVDSYCHGNDSDAKRFLLNSIDEYLENQLYENCEDDEPFCSFWFNLIHVIRSESVKRFSKIKDNIKARKIQDYPGENVESIVTDFLSDWKELNGAGMYDQALTMDMLEAIMEAGGESNEDFRHPLRALIPCYLCHAGMGHNYH